MEAAGPSTSAGTSASDKEKNLELAERAFTSTQTYRALEAKVSVRRRQRGLRHVAEDILFVVSFGESHEGNMPILKVLLTVHQSILTLVRKLKSFFNDK